MLGPASPPPDRLPSLWKRNLPASAPVRGEKAAITRWGTTNASLIVASEWIKRVREGIAMNDKYIDLSKELLEREFLHRCRDAPVPCRILSTSEPCRPSSSCTGEANPSSEATAQSSGLDRFCS